MDLARDVIAATLALASMFRADAAHTGAFPSSAAANFSGIQWRVRTGGLVHATPVIDGDTVYIGSNDGELYALDVNTGDVRWRFDAGSPVDSSAAVSNQRVYFQDRRGKVYALNARTGKALWKRRFGPARAYEFGHDNYSDWSSSPAVTDNTVVIGGIDGTLRAFDASSGREIWRLQTQGRIESSPAVAGGTVYVGSLDGKLYAADLQTGRLRWVYATQASGQSSAGCHFDCHSIRSSPVVAGDAVLFGARDGFLYALDAGTGALRWRVDHQTAWVNSSPAVADGVAYDGDSSNKRIEAVDIASGKVLWTYTSDGLIFASPAIAGDAILEADFSGNLFALDRRSGKLLWKYRNAADAIVSSPTVYHDRVFYGSDDGSVYAVNVSAGQGLARAVFFDTDHPLLASYTHAVSGIGPQDVRDYLAVRGYNVLDESGLADFLKARIEDRAPSVVVFATDYVPDTALLRAYLDAGGKVVWSGFPPNLFVRDPKTGAPQKANLPGLQQLLGVNYDAALSEPIGAYPTADGRRWGLSGNQIVHAEVDPASVSTVLAFDDRGMAGAWVKRFSGRPGSGFVSLPPLGLDLIPDANANFTLDDLQTAAEYFPLDYGA